MRTRTTLAPVILAVVFAASGGPARPDEATEPTEVDVGAIPNHQALISLRDGRATVFVTFGPSTKDSLDRPEATDILPKTDQPVSVRRVPDGVLDTLRVSLRPRAVHTELDTYAWTASGALFVLALSLLSLAIAGSGHPLRTLGFRCLLFGFLLLAVVGVFLPALLDERSGLAIPAGPDEDTAGRVTVELTVVADQAARCEELDTVLVDHFFVEEMDHPNEPPGVEYRPEVAYRGMHHGCWVAHEDVHEGLWDGCIVTHLRGELRRTQVGQPLTLHWKEPSPYRRTVYSTSAALAISAIVFSSGLVALILITFVRFRRHLAHHHGVRNYVLRIVPVLAVAMVVVALIVLLAWPTGPVIERDPEDAEQLYRATLALSESRWELANDVAAAETHSPVPYYIDSVIRYQLNRYRIYNPYTGEEMQRDASPGNYTTRVDNGGAYIVLHYANGQRAVVDCGPVPRRRATDGGR